MRLLTSKLTEYLAKAPAVWLEGQVVQLTRRPGQGTVYLTLRDTTVDMSFSVTLAARVLDALPTPLHDGSHVVLHARPQLFPRRGSLSLAADDLRPIGIGELLARIEHLRRLLAAEGLFADERKRPLPFLPHTIGLICGRASAAEKDVVDNARRRWPEVGFDIRAVAVQGPNAVPDVLAALAALDAEPSVEVIVIARGGGSLEDLLPFSNETLLRAVADCRTPVVSAIGHEVDSPLLDLVADVRASTPTDAAKLVVPDVAEEIALVRGARQRIRQLVLARLDTEGAHLHALRSRPCLTHPARELQPRYDELQRLHDRATRAAESTIDRATDDLSHRRQRLRALSPLATLERGYAVVLTSDSTGEHPITSVAQAGPGQPISVRVADGRFTATVDTPGQQGPGQQSTARQTKARQTKARQPRKESTR